MIELVSSNDTCDKIIYLSFDKGWHYYKFGHFKRNINHLKKKSLSIRITCFDNKDIRYVTTLLEYGFKNHKQIKENQTKTDVGSMYLNSVPQEMIEKIINSE